MKRRICVRSMFFGAVIMLVGLVVGAIVSPPLIAQSSAVFDKVVCREIEVVDENGKRRAFLGRRVTLLSPGHELVGNAFQLFDKDGEKVIELSTDDLMNEIVLYDKKGSHAVRLLEAGGRYTAIQVGQSGKQGFSVDLYDDLHSIAVYDPSETREFEAEGRKFVSEQRAFGVSVTNNRNELQLWGKSPYKRGIGFYGDSNEAKQSTPYRRD